MRERTTGATLLAAGVAVYAVLAVTSLRQKSPAFDEPAHLAAGYTYWKFGDFRLNPEHPPLVKLLAAAPLLFMDVTVREDSSGWTLRRQWDFGRHFLYDWNDADRILFRARLPVVALGVILALAVFLWTRLHWGLPAAALALLLCVLSPDVLAHGQVVTLDLGVTLFFFLTVVAFERLTARPSWQRLVLAGLALGAAFSSKSSAVVLLPVLGALAVVVVASPVATAAPALGARATRAALSLAGMGIIALLVVWTAYGFHARISPDPKVEASFEWHENWPAGAAASRVSSVARSIGLLPEAYLLGLLKVFKHAEARPSFLAGQRSDEGFWSYYPTTIALKTPLALLILIVLALATRREHAAPWRTEAFLWLPPVVYLVLAISRPINIGHRYVLPLYPFFFVAAGRAASWAVSRPWRSPARPIVLALAAWYVLAAARTHPHYLAYFNELAGGPRNGYRHLVDSNLDWGQDLKGLKAYMDASGIRRVKLSYFGTGDPRYYGIDCDLLPGYVLPPPVTMTREVSPGDVVAVSATLLQGVYLPPEMRPLMERLRGMAPVAVVGYSIFVYRADFAWTPGR